MQREIHGNGFVELQPPLVLRFSDRSRVAALVHAQGAAETALFKLDLRLPGSDVVDEISLHQLLCATFNPQFAGIELQLHAHAFRALRLRQVDSPRFADRLADARDLPLGGSVGVDSAACQRHQQRCGNRRPDNP